MTPFLVLPPHREAALPGGARGFADAAARAAAERRFYDEHGSPGPVRALRLIEWLGRRLGRTRRPGPTSGALAPAGPAGSRSARPPAPVPPARRRGIRA